MSGFCVVFLSNGNLRLSSDVFPDCVNSDAALPSGEFASPENFLEMLNVLLVDWNNEMFFSVMNASFMAFAIGLGGGWLYKAIRQM